MKRYFEDNDGTYILAYGIGGHGGTEITEERYNAILNAVASMPQETETMTYRLKADLTYEPIEIEPIEADLTDSEALNIILGGAE